MTDIVERLRAEGAMTGHYHVPAIQREAAAEIEWLREESERLRAEVVLLEATGAECADEIERLRAALRSIANNTGCVEACPCWAKLRGKAERALKEGGL